MTDPQSDPSSPAPRVVIAGAGVAGLSAAQVLVDAGVQVTVLEKSDAVGGKCFSYVDDTLGHTIEHGIHGVFPRYLNLKGLWSDAGIDPGVFSGTTTTGMVGPDGTMHSTQLAKVKGPAPLFLMRMAPRGVLRLRDHLFSLRFLVSTYAARWADDGALDQSTFGAFLRRTGVSARMRSLLLVPYVRNLSYARGDEVSARAATDALNYYVVEDADAVKARFIDGGPSARIFQPWQKDLQRRGVRFVFRQPIESVVMDGAKFVGFGTRAVIRDAELGTQTRLWTRQLGHRYLALHWKPEQRKLRAFEAKCTHQGCPLSVDDSGPEPRLSCPCHGGQFSADGQVLRAPPTAPLPELPMRRDAGAGLWYVDGEGAQHGAGGAAAAAPEPAAAGVEAGDYAVMAMDLRATQQVLPSELDVNPSTAGVPLLRSTSVMVLRMRFSAVDGAARWSGPDSGVFSAEDFLDNFFALHTFQQEFQALPDLLLECHIGDSEQIQSLDDAAIYDRALRVLQAYFPDEQLAARLQRERSRILRHPDVFSLFAPGDHARSPTVSDPAQRPNLMLAGDWVRPDDPDHRSWFMERAAVTGIEAANAILRAAGRSDAQRDVLSVAAPAISRWLSAPLRAYRALRRAVRRVVGVD